MLEKVTAKTGRYIKLGSGGRWENLCLKDGTLRLGYYEIPHEAALKGDLQAIKSHYPDSKAGAASNHARQILNFYDVSDDVIWFTFANGFLWWCKAEPVIEYLGNDKQKFPDGSRLRRTKGQWYNTNINGTPLRMTELNGEFVKIAGFQGTICDTKPHLLNYILNKINNENSSEMETAQQAVSHLLASLQPIIKSLHWKDFETLVDLIFSRSGWQRVSIVGETMKTADIELVMPVTGERAMVQVKSQTNQVELEEYIDAFDSWEIPRLFYVYHTSKHPISLKSPDSRITLVGPEQIASFVLDAGLVEWLLKKSR